LPAILEGLVGVLADRSPAVRRAAAAALGEMGHKARPVVKRLVLSLKDDEKGVRETAAVALSKIDRKATEAIPILVRALKEKVSGQSFCDIHATGTLANPRLSEQANLDEAIALQRFGVVAVGPLVALLGEENLSDQTVIFLGNYYRRVSVRAAIAWLLGSFGEEGRKAVPALRRALAAPDRSLRREAAVALGLIEPGAPDVAPVLLEALRVDGRAWLQTGMFHFQAQWLSPSTRQILAHASEAAARGLAELLREEDLDPPMLGTAKTGRGSLSRELQEKTGRGSLSRELLQSG
jgi:HEAT repeat protein